MNCDQCQHQLSAWIDNELSPSEMDQVEKHVRDCSACQQVLHELREVDLRLKKLTLPTAASERTLAAIGSEETITPSVRENRHWRRVIPWAVAALAASIVIAIVSIESDPPEVVPVARLIRSTGAMEVLDSKTGIWRIVSSQEASSFPAGTHLRTLPGVVCEIETTNRTKLRLDASAELVLVAPDHIQVVEGQIWSRVDGEESLRVDTRPPPGAAQTQGEDQPNDDSILTMTCASDSEFQWTVNDKESVFQSLAGAESQLTMDVFRCPVGAGEKVSIQSDFEVKRETADVRSAKLWQVPLLAIDQADSELGGLLESLLVQIGTTKAGFMQEQQVRELGPRGAIPLLAYVNSDRSKNNPPARLHAMRIAIDIADQSALDRLRSLQSDADSVIAEYANEAVRRLNDQ